MNPKSRRELSCLSFLKGQYKQYTQILSDKVKNAKDHAYLKHFFRVLKIKEGNSGKERGTGLWNLDYQWGQDLQPPNPPHMTSGSHEGLCLVPSAFTEG